MGEKKRMYEGKNNNDFVSVVVAAAGKGSRMGLQQNKQYVEISGKPILARTIKAFEDCGLVDEIVITAGDGEIDYCRDNIIKKYGFTRVKAIVPGGNTRQRSVYNGLKMISPGGGIVLIHDGARPFIGSKYIQACIEAAREYGAACVAVPVKDTIKRTCPEGFVKDTVERDQLWAIQTPQAFRYSIIMEAHKRAAADGFEGTDDAVLAERLGYRVKLVMGSYHNIKITTEEDLTIAEGILYNCRQY